MVREMAQEAEWRGFEAAREREELEVGAVWGALLLRRSKAARFRHWEV